jgi:hypothetical protein
LFTEASIQSSATVTREEKNNQINSAINIGYTYFGHVGSIYCRFRGLKLELRLGNA